jgi:hypothetical protein
LCLVSNDMFYSFGDVFQNCSNPFGDSLVLEEAIAKKYFFQIWKMDVLELWKLSCGHKKLFLIENEIFYPFWDIFQNCSDSFRDAFVLYEAIAKMILFFKFKTLQKLTFWEWSAKNPVLAGPIVKLRGAGFKHCF